MTVATVSRFFEALREAGVPVHSTGPRRSGLFSGGMVNLTLSVPARLRSEANGIVARTIGSEQLAVPVPNRTPEDRIDLRVCGRLLMHVRQNRGHPAIGRGLGDLMAMRSREHSSDEFGKQGSGLAGTDAPMIGAAGAIFSDALTERESGVTPPPPPISVRTFVLVFVVMFVIGVVGLMLLLHFFPEPTAIPSGHLGA